VKKLKEYWREMDLLEKRPDFSEDHHWSWIERLSTLFRRAMLKWWKKKVEKSFTLWYDEKGKHQDDDGAILTAGEDAI